MSSVRIRRAETDLERELRENLRWVKRITSLVLEIPAKQRTQVLEALLSAEWPDEHGVWRRRGRAADGPYSALAGRVTSQARDLG